MPAISRMGPYHLFNLIIEREVFAESVRFSEDAMTVSLDDGRAMSIPLAWYPRLLNGTARERERYELIGHGEGIHWPELDEDISVEGLIAGRRSAESNASLAGWLQKRKQYASWARNGGGHGQV